MIIIMIITIIIIINDNDNHNNIMILRKPDGVKIRSPAGSDKKHQLRQLNNTNHLNQTIYTATQQLLNKHTTTQQQTNNTQTTN